MFALVSETAPTIAPWLKVAAWAEGAIRPKPMNANIKAETTLKRFVVACPVTSNRDSKKSMSPPVEPIQAKMLGREWRRKTQQ